MEGGKEKGVSGQGGQVQGILSIISCRSRIPKALASEPFLNLPSTQGPVGTLSAFLNHMFAKVFHVKSLKP